MGSTGPTEKPTVVLIHGAWHDSSCWNPVISLLKEHQYPFRSIDLLTAGGEITMTAEDDALHIQKTTSELVADGKELILVMHSYGGVPGTLSAKGLLRKDRETEHKPGGIVSLVYVTSFLLPEGASLASFLGGWPDWIAFDGNKMTVINSGDVFYNDLSGTDKAQYTSRVLHHSKPSFYTTLTYPAYKEVPTTYLLCKQDNAIPLVAQQAMAGIAGPKATIYTFNSGHLPILSMPDKVVDVIRGAAGEVIV